MSTTEPSDHPTTKNDESTTNQPTKAPTKQTQSQKLKEANNKYKQLLKLAKERIETQQNEIDTLQAHITVLEKKTSNRSNAGTAITTTTGKEDGFQVVSEDWNEAEEQNGVVTRVCLCLKEQMEEGSMDVLWALLEYETAPLADDVMPQPNSYKQWKRWKSFQKESDLIDFVRLNAASGEPLSIPPFSLSPNESDSIKRESQQVVAHVTEEFRRYRVRAEVARKQADNALKAAQVENVTQAQRRIESENTKGRIQSYHSNDFPSNEIKDLKQELVNQEVRWKEAYNLLEQENKLLKDGGPRAEATLAGQWRHRYEECLKEKDELVAKMEMMSPQKGKGGETKFEAKYRSLKEEYRLYRKKAKEIFDDQQRGKDIRQDFDDGSTSEDPRIAYLRSLMVSYLTSESDVKDQMENAIYTVLKFSTEDKQKVKESRDANSSYFW